MTYYLKIKTAELVADKFGHHIKITKIGLYDENGKWIKWVKLNEYTLQQLCNTSFVVEL